MVLKTDVDKGKSANGSITKSRPTKYIQANKDIEKVLNNRSMRSNLNTVLKNGNNSSIIIEKKTGRYLVYTYAVNLVAIIITKAYLDNPNNII